VGEAEPAVNGMLDVGDGNLLYWESHGTGKPAVALHGGPGTGFVPQYLEFFPESRYRIVLFDQRNCGRSTPPASDPAVDLSANTTQHLVADIERLREHLGIERWLVLGGSWGSTLALAYAETHPERVTELVLFAVTTGRHEEFDWLFRGGLARFFPKQWERLSEHVGNADDVPDAYYRLLNDPDPDVRRKATVEWCLWESATPHWPPREAMSERYEDPDTAYALARLVTHYVRANAWLEDGELIGGAAALADIPGALVNGRFDFQSPIEHAWTLRRAWPRAELTIIDDAGHSMKPEIIQAVLDATDRFSRR
jgi:proline iminopeptidase